MRLGFSVLAEANGLGHGVFQAFAGLEFRLLAGFDLDGGAGAGVAAGGGGALGHIEFAKRGQVDFLTGFQGFHDDFAAYFPEFLDLGFGFAGFFGYGFDKFTFVHSKPRAG